MEFSRVQDSRSEIEKIIDILASDTPIESDQFEFCYQVLLRDAVEKEDTIGHVQWPIGQRRMWRDIPIEVNDIRASYNHRNQMWDVSVHVHRIELHNATAEWNLRIDTLVFDGIEKHKATAKVAKDHPILRQQMVNEVNGRLAKAQPGHTVNHAEAGAPISAGQAVRIGPDGKLHPVGNVARHSVIGVAVTSAAENEQIIFKYGEK